MTFNEAAMAAMRNHGQALALGASVPYQRLLAFGISQDTGRIGWVEYCIDHEDGGNMVVSDVRPLGLAEVMDNYHPDELRGDLWTVINVGEMRKGIL